MVKAIVLLSLLAQAAAFTNSLSARTSFSLYSDATADEAPAAPAEPAAPTYKASVALPFMESPPNLEGYVGNLGFDPFRFSDFMPVDFLREAELKHGRMCMLAVVGFAFVDIFPDLRVSDAYQGLTAITAHDALVQQGAMGQLLMWISFAEIVSTVSVTQMLNGSGRAPGDFGLDPPGLLTGRSPEYVNDMKLKEIVHCRLAMFAFSGMVTQAVLYESHFPFVSS